MVWKKKNRADFRRPSAKEKGPLARDAMVIKPPEEDAKISRRTVQPAKTPLLCEGSEDEVVCRAGRKASFDLCARAEPSPHDRNRGRW